MGRGDDRRRIIKQDVPKPLYAKEERARGAKPWIPIAGLPLDLQVAALRGIGPVLGNSNVRVRAAPTWLKMLAVSTLAVALIAALSTPQMSGFGSFVRAVAILVGGALVGIIVGWRRALGFRAAAGQKLVIGPASLIVVDASHVWVVPAEELVVDWATVHRGSELICDSNLHLHMEWIERLRKVVKAAETNEALRDGDRFRKAAAGAARVSWLQRTWTSRQPQIVAAGLALSAGLLLEAGPLHARGVEIQAANAAVAALVNAASGLETGRERALDAVTRQLTASAASKLRARLLADSMTGSEEYARAFLVSYPVDEARLRVIQRLTELCVAKVPIPPYDLPRNRALRTLVRVACESADRRIHYTTTGDAGAESARIFMKALADGASKLSPEAIFLEATPLDLGAASAPGGPTAAGAPFVRLAMRVVAPARYPGDATRTETWRFDMVAVDAADVPIPGGDYHVQATINHGQGTIKMTAAN